MFMFLYALTAIISVLMGGYTFSSVGASGQPVEYAINNMMTGEKIRWIFDNAILQNWLAFGNGVLGVILISVLGVGVAEESGMLAALIKKAGSHINERFLPLLLVFLGIMSSVASDAGYLILIPLAGLLYAGTGKNPLIGMAAAFAGVSAGFSANLIPATPIDAIVGNNAMVFAESQGVPFTTAAGEPLNASTMNYFFIAASVFLLCTVGAWVTQRFVAPKLEKQSYIIPEDMDLNDFTVKPEEHKALKMAGLGLIISALAIAGLAMGPLAAYTNDAGRTVNPFVNNMILVIALFFIITGVFYGVSIGKFKSVTCVVNAMVKQMNTMGYILVLTFFCYAFLALLGQSGLGTYVTYLGANFLQALGLDAVPVLLLIGFIIVTAIINLLVGGLTSKWMLLGPIFIPMLYQVNPAMTPDLVSAAFRVADSSTNIITPMMTYAGVILAFMRKYKPEMTIGDQISIMLPYSVAFLTIWTTFLVIFFMFNIPMGF
ncbi:AbgT family transporter [Parendozoicomonas haliclonae]|uniref:AbgT family transporter n=1 Tax=Parendozoicomonas haliclonae TaxID=1960125 RepID=UPI0024182898|nr:AbgT family transporter [Parendozoicomonas haliclonae]